MNVCMVFYMYVVVATALVGKGAVGPAALVDFSVNVPAASVEIGVVVSAAFVDLDVKPCPNSLCRNRFYCTGSLR